MDAAEMVQANQGRNFIILFVVGYFILMTVLCFVAAAERQISTETNGDEK